MKHKVVLRFSKEIWDKPIIYKLIKEYDLIVNILKASVLPKRESYLILELEGDSDVYSQGIDYLKECGVVIDSIDQEIKRDEDICTHCGACTAICPTNALSIDRDTMEVLFDSERCSGCAMCVPVCPPRAMEVFVA